MPGHANRSGFDPRKGKIFAHPPGHLEPVEAIIHVSDGDRKRQKL